MVNNQKHTDLYCGTMSIIQNIMSCMRGYRSNAYVSGKSTKVKFGFPLEKLSQKTCHHLPKPLFDLLVYLAQEGIRTNELFRRPGNSTQMKKIIEMLSNGIEIDWPDYNIYTVANVVKKYFISLPGGLFGRKFELLLLSTYSMPDDQRRVTFHKILHQLPNANRELVILMFGILFRMVSHYVNEYAMEIERAAASRGGDASARSAGSAMAAAADTKCTEIVLAEGVAKSVAGSIFHSCTSSPDQVERAATVLRGLILDFPCFDEEYVDFFYRSTLISYGNQYQGYFQFRESGKQNENKLIVDSPPHINSCNSGNIPNPKQMPSAHPEYCELPIVTLTNPFGGVENMSTDSSPVIKIKFSKEDDDLSLRSARSSDFDRIQQRQLELARLRSDWFLNAGSCNNINRKPPKSDEFGYYESNDECDTSMASNSHIQFQIVATSGPDILQTLPHRNRLCAANKITGANLTVPHGAEVSSFRSSAMSSIGNTSRNSFVDDEIYSDY